MFTAALSIFYWFILSKTENIKKNDGSFCLKDKSLLKFLIFKESSQKIPFEFVLLAHYVWLSGKRGAGVSGYGVPGCGKHGVWGKTRGLSGKPINQQSTRGLSGKSQFCYFKLQ